LNIAKSGIVMGLALGAFHLGWATLVAIAWAQPFLDFVFWVHFIKPVYTVEPFETMRAIALICLTWTIGFLMGAMFAMFWNALHRR
jgi:hypothetical protein